MANENNEQVKEEIRKIIQYVQGLNNKDTDSIRENIELVLQTEGYAVRQMPKYKLSPSDLGLIREAIQQNRKMLCFYFYAGLIKMLCFPPPPSVSREYLRRLCPVPLP